MAGKLILVVGPSGVGKDTLIEGARAELAGDDRFDFARRVITRPADAGGEDHEAVDEAEFERRVAAGAFFAHWRANGLGYGAPRHILDRLRAGANVVLNGSRRALADIVSAAERAEIDVDVIQIDADPEVIAQRLAARGRESAEEIAQRRARASQPPPAMPGVAFAAVMNDGAPEEGVRRFVAALLGAARLPLKLTRAPFDLGPEPVCLLHRESRVVAAAALDADSRVEITANGRSIAAKLGLCTDARLVSPLEAALSLSAFETLGAAEGDEATLERSPSPKSRAVLRKKVAGGALAAAEIALVVRDLLEGRYSPAETAGFLVAASTNLSFDEIVALTRIRADHMDRFVWDAPMVVDKHSMGGVPGSRITMIVAPLVAAHGLTIPKTSSRAITSAAGTADAMEVFCRVDLDRAEMRGVVDACGACVVWNGKINHSPLDDVMNAINRPLGVSSRLLDVSSILSKKLACGASAVLVDIPAGPSAKLKTAEDGARLAAMFEKVGQAVGLKVAARVTDGARPVGRGVGPALEARDVTAVLRGEAGAPTDLREKALDFAAALISWDPAFGGDARARAAELLRSGAAWDAFARITAAQGAWPSPPKPGAYYHDLVAPRSGRLARFDSFALSGVARAAGAPADPSAGVDVLAQLGGDVTAGAPVLRIHASGDAQLARAAEEAAARPPFEIG